MKPTEIDAAPPQAVTVAVEPSLAGLEPARQAMLDALAGQPLGDVARYRLELVLEELLSNAVRHGAAKRLSLSVWREPGRTVLRVEDDGLPFDPTTWQGSNAVPNDATAASTGGRGILLVKRYAASLRHTALVPGNRLEVAITDS